MNNPSSLPSDAAGASSSDSSPVASELTHEQMQSALFAQLVMQQSSMATMLMGQTPHPETGQRMRNLDGARLFIDQLEMLEAKTRGNLNKTEQVLLKQTLMALRMAFVEAVEKPEPEPQPASPAPETENKTAPAETTGAEESKKRFSKKFSL